ncbi:MAG: hypothetical protein IIC99_00670 [Chloroflexi bacterium]|nr:hypothetical protein [Chloroflexota bacterium]
MARSTGAAPATAPSRQTVSGQVSGQISRLKPWVAIALLLTAAILGIYGYQAFNYWTSWDKTGSLQAQTDTLTVILSRDEPALAEIAGRLDSGQQRLERLRREFDYESIDSMISMLSTTASAAGVGLASITVSDAVPEEIDGIRYQIQPIAVTALGSPQEIFRFLESLSGPAPSATVSSVQLSGLDSDSVSKLGFQFYLSPQAVVDGEAKDQAKR